MIPNVSPTATSNQDAIFIWLDILGFSNALEDGNAYNELHGLLKKFQTTFLSEHRYDLQVISDGIIIKIDSKNIDEISKIFKEIGEKQFQFILTEGYFIRGGIAVGSHFNLKEGDKNFFLMGNGLSRAVKMEAKSVHHAVIGTNLKTIQKIRDICELKSIEEPLFGLKKTVNENGEDLFFIDFIQQNIDFENMLHKELRKNRANPVIQKKYLWTYRYYINKFEKTTRPFDEVLGVLL